MWSSISRIGAWMVTVGVATTSLSCTATVGKAGGGLGGIAGTGGAGTGGAATGGAAGVPPPPSCDGSGLVNDPSTVRPKCPPPLSPNPGCPPGELVADVARSSGQTSPQRFMAESAVAVDPRQGVDIVYAATIDAAAQGGDPGPSSLCVTSKRVRVFRSAAGAAFSELAFSGPFPADQWVTDPDLAVGGDGTLYLSVLRTHGFASCVGASRDTQLAEIQLWFAPPGATTLQPAIAPGNSPFGDGAPAVPFTSPMTLANLDHPQIAASPVPGGPVVVTFVQGNSSISDEVVTLQRGPSGTYVETANRLQLIGTGVWPTLAFDHVGDLYAAVTSQQVLVTRYRLVGQNWQFQTSGSPTVPGGQPTFVSGTLVDVPTAPVSANLPSDPTAALAVGRVGDTSDPIVFVGFEVNIGGVRQIQVAAANSNNLGQSNWILGTPIRVPASALFTFNPKLSLNGSNNVLDLTTISAIGSAGAGTSQVRVGTFFHRLAASTLELLLGPVPLNAPSATDPVEHMPTIADLPSKWPGNFILWPGEYQGLAHRDLVANVTWPELRATGAPLADVDLGQAAITTNCGASMSFNLVDPDSTWNCPCLCGSSESDPITVVGCASASATTAGAACAQICAGAGSLCGQSLTCAPAPCFATGAGTRVSTASCAVSDGPPRGAPTAGLADYTATAAAGSLAVISVAGQPANTPVSGRVFFNVSTSPPAAGSSLEIALLDIHPADVFLGGPIGADLRDMKVVHRSRLQGLFTDAKHFRIEPGMAPLVVTLRTQIPGDEFPPPPVNLTGTNAAPLTGTFDPAAGTLALDGGAADSLGNSMELHFRGTITARPADTDGDGIIDAVDKCPGAISGPDRSPPTFTFVPPSMTITKCKGVVIGKAIASDPCGVTVTNDAPSAFPLGTTLVTWTARDQAGNVATATQSVTAILGNDVSCCPLGTKIIVGTSNNDTLNGTTGSDCIIALGGQDNISGGGGNDFISGGDGDDVISGGDGNDRLYGGSGQDILSGGNGNDVLEGNDGVDQLRGDVGDDVLQGGQGGDQLFGGVGNDTLGGGADDDRLFGGDGQDIVMGGTGNDTMSGDAGNDTLFGEDGDDHLDGGTGADFLDGGPGHNQCIDDGAVAVCKVSRGDD